MLEQYAHATTLVNADALTSFFTNDGALVEPGMAPLVGRKAIHDFLAPFDGKAVVESDVIRTDSLRSVGSARRAWGRYEQVAGERGGRLQQYRGRFVADFVRGPDGAWMIERLAMLATDSHEPAYAIDHVVIGSADLERGMQEFQASTGITPQVGGVHPGRGTRNALASFGEQHYVEIMAPDPAQGETDRTAELSSLARLMPIGWAIRTSDIDATARALRAAGFPVDGPVDGARVLPDGRRLAWRSLKVVNREFGPDPFFIEWSTMDSHPSMTAPRGCTLGELSIAAPLDSATRALMRTVGVHVAVVQAASPSMRLSMDCGAKGTVVFGR